MGVGDNFLHAGLDIHVLGLEALTEVVDPSPDLVLRELLGGFVSLGDHFSGSGWLHIKVSGKFENNSQILPLNL